MTSSSEIVLYHSPASRAFTAFWLLEELGLDFRVQTVDISKGDQKKPEYLAINPAGKVPAVSDHGEILTENPAICIAMADRYGYGDLAPKIDDPTRGAYLKWIIYATAVVEPVRDVRKAQLEMSPYHHGFGDYDDMVAILIGAVKDREYLLGDKFTAADVMLGSVISTSLINKLLPEDNALLDYNYRLTLREAYQRAADATWPPYLFNRSGG